eukprot:8600405-Pyramimonas_sp.AAC.1
MEADDVPLLDGDISLSASVAGDVTGYVFLQTYDMLPFQTFIAYGDYELSVPMGADVAALHVEASWRKIKQGVIMDPTNVPFLGRGVTVFDIGFYVGLKAGLNYTVEAELSFIGDLRLRPEQSSEVQAWGYFKYSNDAMWSDKGYYISEGSSKQAIELTFEISGSLSLGLQPALYFGVWGEAGGSNLRAYAMIQYTLYIKAVLTWGYPQLGAVPALYQNRTNCEPSHRLRLVLESGGKDLMLGAHFSGRI